MSTRIQTNEADRTDDAAAALVRLYGIESTSYLVTLFGAGWMTDAEREAFRLLREALRDIDERGCI